MLHHLLWEENILFLKKKEFFCQSLLEYSFYCQCLYATFHSGVLIMTWRHERSCSMIQQVCRLHRREVFWNFWLSFQILNFWIDDLYFKYWDELDICVTFSWFQCFCSWFLIHWSQLAFSLRLSVRWRVLN